MNMKAKLGIIAVALLTAGCTQVHNPDGSVTTGFGVEPDDSKLIDNRELHINSHNSNASAPVIGSNPVVVNPINPVVANPVLNHAVSAHLGLNGLDSTVFVPSRYLQETPESKKVQAGASQFAMAKGCMFMQRYRIAINADFTGTLNLMKYRSAGMGAEWINVQFHAESTPVERLSDYGASLFLVDGTRTLENQIFTVMEADLFDCG